MTILPSMIEKNGAQFASNAAHNATLAGALRQKIATSSQGGSASAREKHTARGKLLPRDRVHRLLDPGSAFLESARLPPTGCMAMTPPAPA